jgi:hypothetical protein
VSKNSRMRALCASVSLYNNVNRDVNAIRVTVAVDQIR